MELTSQIVVVICVLSIFTIVGCCGNFFVIFVYARKKDKSTTRMFILTLAVTDFLTCLIIIPYTILWEYLAKKFMADALCQLYFFLITTNVPFSFLIMVMIAFDRYFKICRPLSNFFNETVAKGFIFGLLFFSLLLGIIPAVGLESFDSSKHCRPDPDFVNSSYGSLKQICDVNLIMEDNATYPDGTCIRTNRIISADQRFAYQKFYASLFLIALIIVLILYALIFRTIVLRRAKKTQRKLKKTTLCDMCSDQESTLVTYHMASLNGAHDHKVSHQESEGKTANKATNTPREPDVDGTASRELIVSQQSSKSIKDRQFIANTKTAFILFIVTVVFIVAYLPAWLMATRLIHFNSIIFYLYFSYNVANPVIYAFCNPAFRKEMQSVLGCNKRLFINKS